MIDLWTQPETLIITNLPDGTVGEIISPQDLADWNSTHLTSIMRAIRDRELDIVIYHKQNKKMVIWNEKAKNWKAKPLGKEKEVDHYVHCGIDYLPTAVSKEIFSGSIKAKKILKGS